MRDTFDTDDGRDNPFVLKGGNARDFLGGGGTEAYWMIYGEMLNISFKEAPQGTVHWRRGKNLQ